MSVVTPPESLQYRNVVGHLIYLDADTVVDTDEYPDAKPAVGKVSFKPTVDRLFSGPDETIIIPKTLTATLDGEGRFSIYLATTDAPDISPVNWGYTVTVSVEGMMPWVWTSQVPSGTVVNLKDLPGFPVPAPSTGGGTGGSTGSDHNHNGVYSLMGHAHDERYYTEVESDSRFIRLVNGNGPDSNGNVTVEGGGGGTGGVTDHDQLTGRSTANQHPISAITGLQTALDNKQPVGDYAATAHNHDARYYTRAESDSALNSKANTLDVDNALAGKASTVHDHDTRYPTHSEVGTLLTGKSDTGHTHAAGQVSGLAPVATSGDYADLANKPTIPTDFVTSLNVEGLWQGTQAQYDALGTYDPATIYFIKDA